MKITNFKIYKTENDMRISINKDKLLKQVGYSFTKFMIRILMWGILIGSLITITILTAWGTVAILMKGNV